tara:strand:+ start:1048 stop:1221 length:174 start_codon:yes stop_codon:yes gene_type:complete
LIISPSILKVECFDDIIEQEKNLNITLMQKETEDDGLLILMIELLILPPFLLLMKLS